LPYYDVMHAGPSRWISEGLKQKLGSDQVPAGFAIFPRDLSHPPRAWAQRFFNVERWTEYPRGGHFAAMEQPDALGRRHPRLLPAAAQPRVVSLSGSYRPAYCR
jgi:pimeloyl-ACP methyl ester carboxylesterase